jgi:hypothetical protein
MRWLSFYPFRIKSWKNGSEIQHGNMFWHVIVNFTSNVTYASQIRASPPLRRKADSRIVLWRAPSMHWIFLGWHSPTLTLHTGSSTRKTVKNIPCKVASTQKWHDSEIASGWRPGIWAHQEQRSPGRIVSGAGSLKSPGKFEEPGQEGWGRFFCQAASKGLPRAFDAQGWRCSYDVVIAY